MKFRLKITFCMLCLLCLLFGVGGSVLISFSFHTSFEQEKESAHGDYQTMLNTLQVVGDIEQWKDYTNVSNTLTQIVVQNASSLTVLRLFSESEMLFENNTSFGYKVNNKKRADVGSCLISSVSDTAGNYYLQLSGAFMIGDEVLYLDANKDITHIYQMRTQQEKTYQKIYFAMAVVCTFLAYSIALLLTRPLSKLSKASKEIASGNLAYRSKLYTNDEIGALSSAFDDMADHMEKNVLALRNAVERQERFMGSFTHELKTPMASIIGYADLLRSQTLSPDEQAEAANYIFTEGKRLENMSLKLLDIFVAGNCNIKLVKVSPSAVIKDVAAALELSYRQNQIEISCVCEEGVCLLESDLLRSLIINLMDNAKNALTHGGKINVFSEMLTDGCRIRVTDNGRGIPEEEMKHITEAFYRADKSRSRTQGGAGLGLTLCAKIVELHDGIMTFESQKGQGTSVTVELKGGGV